MSMASVALSSTCEDSLTVPNFFRGNHGHLTDESILIFLTVGGPLVPIPVLESDSVASVKLRIQNHKGFSVKNQKLVFDGRKLSRSDSRVCDYGVSNGAVLRLVLQLSNLLAITVETVSGKEYEFHVERSKHVSYLKHHIAEKGNGLFDLKDEELVCDGEELEDQRPINEYCKDNDAFINLLVRKSAKVRAKPVGKDFEVFVLASDKTKKIADGDKGVGLYEIPPVDPLSAVHKQFCSDIILKPVIINTKIELPLVIRKLIRSTFSGLDRGHKPIKSSEGCGGVYFIPDLAGEDYISVFKPVDEEPMAVNNPKGLPKSEDGEGLKKGTQVGGGALREVAAYILDHPNNKPGSVYHDEVGFAGVPPTALVKCLHESFNHPDGYDGSSKNMKIGSLQMYMKNSGSCEDIGPGSFPVQEVHKISVLDIRLANTDRHAGNILVNKDMEGRTVLIPIDHGYCFPSNFEDCTFDWLYWPQARQPFSLETIEYIKSLDVEDDIRLLKLHGWDMPQDCVRVFRVSSMLLKKGVKKGLTPFAIGSIMCRETLKKESLIEHIVREAADSVLPGTSEASFLDAVSSIMDRELDELSSQNP